MKTKPVIKNKIIPLAGISVLLLFVSLPNASADLCGDTINLDVVEGLGPGGTSIFSGSDVVQWNDSFDILDGNVTINFAVFCDGGSNPIFFPDDIPGDGISYIFFDYVNNTPDPQNIPEHSFWFTDLEWTDATTGEVTDFQVNGGSGIVAIFPGFTQTTIHAATPAFQLVGTGQANDLQITAMHPVGGEFSPMSSSALILAGVQNTSAWMLPLLVSSIGIAALLVQKRKLKTNSCPSCRSETDDTFMLGNELVGKCINSKCRVSLFHVE